MLSSVWTMLTVLSAFIQVVMEVLLPGCLLFLSELSNTSVYSIGLGSSIYSLGIVNRLDD